MPHKCFLSLCILLASGASAAADPAYTESEPPQEARTPIRLNLVSTCLAADQCSTFLRVIDASGLKTFLQEEGPMTLLAPTDAAFEKMDAAEVEALTDPENAERAEAFIHRHLMPASLTVSELLAETQPAWNGDSLRFERQDGKLHVNGVAILKDPVPARNGQVLFLEAVLRAGQSGAIQKVVRSRLAGGLACRPPVTALRLPCRRRNASHETWEWAARSAVSTRRQANLATAERFARHF